MTQASGAIEEDHSDQGADTARGRDDSCCAGVRSDHRRRGADLRHRAGRDTAASTLTLQTTAKGKTRDVTILLKPGSKIVRFARPTEPGKTGFVEQPIALGDHKAGWVVSVTTKHEGGSEVAEIVKVVLEK